MCKCVLIESLPCSIKVLLDGDFTLLFAFLHLMIPTIRATKAVKKIKMPQMTLIEAMVPGHGCTVLSLSELTSPEHVANSSWLTILPISLFVIS